MHSDGATGDMSSINTMTAAQIGVEIEAARAAMDGSRHNRAGIAYTDAKLRVAVFNAERRRRSAPAIAMESAPPAALNLEAVFVAQAAQHALIRDMPTRSAHRAATEAGRPCGTECAGTLGTTCTCECGGANHGALLRDPSGRAASRWQRAGRSVWSTLPAMSEDEPW